MGLALLGAQAGAAGGQTRFGCRDRGQYQQTGQTNQLVALAQGSSFRPAEQGTSDKPTGG